MLITELQEKTVVELAEIAPDNWDTISVNMEIDEIDGETVMSPSAELVFDNETVELELTIDVTDCFEELRTAMKQGDSAGRAWTICNLKVDSDGNYNFDFSYAEPPRLGALK